MRDRAPPRRVLGGTSVADSIRGMASREHQHGGPIDHVLQAEREAERIVARAEEEGAAAAAAARDRARAIRERADRRVGAIAASAKSKTAALTAAMRAEAETRRGRLSRRARDPAALARAVERVADWLLGASS